MGRDDFPVDTHVHRVSKRLGWVDSDFVGSNREKTYQLLNDKIPDDLKHSLHILLVEEEYIHSTALVTMSSHLISLQINHGRRICKAGAPSCGECPLQSNCLYFKQEVLGDDQVKTEYKAEKKRQKR